MSKKDIGGLLLIGIGAAVYLWFSKSNEVEEPRSPSEAIEQVFKRNNIKIIHDDIELYPKQVFEHQVFKHIVKKEEEILNNEKSIEEAIRFIRRQRG